MYVGGSSTSDFGVTFSGVFGAMAGTAGGEWGPSTAHIYFPSKWGVRERDDVSTRFGHHCPVHWGLSLREAGH
jgi:hypothetical protein